MFSKRTRTPLAGALRVTTPLKAKPFTQIFPFGTQSPISTLAPGFTGLAASTRHPPALVLERLPQIGVGLSSTRSSTATKHLIRGCRRRSVPQFVLNRSGSKGGVAEVGVGTGCSTLGSSTELAGFLELIPPAFISRIAASRASSRFSTGASR